MAVAATLAAVGGSACCFKLLNAAVGVLPAPGAAAKRAWKWRNTCTSLAHSALSGAGALIWFVRMHGGYFIHDFLDLALNEPFRKSWEVLLHHSMVISCFGFALRSGVCVGFAVASLLVEIHSVFLHIRQLLLLSGRTNRTGEGAAARRPSLVYSVASWLNLGALVVFRLGTLCWMTRWLTRQTQRLPLFVLMLGTAGLSLISTMSLGLFYRLLRADVLTNPGQKH
ncbi:TLC domain-containing protein 2-like [Salarias fasciatus]|uniref:TLC domain-containing protein 2-like n=1 Tax=Salarias fasciatus TaxID=181472 RepID=UPI0011764C7A|nr:TLC domain-containing protein 2-like [Salarias fasciatus]